MTTAPHLTARRRLRRTKRRNSLSLRVARLALTITAVLSVALAVAAIFLALAYSNLTQDLPAVEMLADMLDPARGSLLQPTRLYDRTAQHILLTLENPAVTQRRYVPLQSQQGSQLPQTLVDATIAIADHDFSSHPGFTWSPLDGSSDPTLAERLAADLLLWGEPPGSRKTLRARLLAAQITAQYGREQVLEWYLNSADYGQGTYGVAAAAQVYFGKPVESLTLAEAALLAAASQAPALNPIEAPQRAVERQGEVLEAMLVQGLITSDQALSANQIPLHIQSPLPAPSNPAEDFTALVLAQLTKQIDETRLRRGGLQIITTLDYDLQIQAGCTSALQLARLAGQQVDNPQDCPAARLLPTSPRDEVQAAEGLSANLVVLDSLTGQVLALVGEGSRGHPAGSLLSPFVYLTAFTRGLGPASLVWDIPNNLPPDLADYTNPDGQFHGPVRIRTALANDYLAPTLQLLGQIGAQNVWRTAEQFGLPSLQTAAGADAFRLLLDAGGIPLLQAAHAFSTFSNQGRLAGQITDPDAEGPGQLTAAAVLQVADYSGRLWLDWSQPQFKQITSAQLAYLVTDVLSDELSRRTSLGHPNPLEVGRPAAAKLGQTLDNRNAWAVGYTPQRVVAVWLGYTDQDVEGSFPPLASGDLWHAIFNYAHQELPSTTFTQPTGITQTSVCDPSGLLPTADCPKIIEEIFLSGDEPLHPDNLYRTIQINRQTGRLATVFTPPQLIEEKVFLIVPPEAVDWARSVGLPIPPEDYDVIFASAENNPQVNIQTPQMFSYLSGQIDIQGTAAGEDFDFYRLQIGAGLNPRQWLQVGEDQDSPVEDGRLATWDTTGLNGLYALQLLVVRQDQSIDSSIIQVTVDNLPPEIQVLHPAEGDTFTYPQERDLTFQTQVSDNLEISHIEFYVDDQLVSTLSEAPFAVPWNGEVGQHTLEIRAFDRAGNFSQAIVKFEIAR